MPGAVYEKGYDMKKGRTRSVLTGLFAGILILGLLLGGSYLWREYQQKQKQEDLKEKVVDQEALEEPKESNPIDFASLWNLNPDVYAWIDVPGTEISYPVLQSAEDNSYYLEHTIEGEKTLPGAIYSENYNSKDFSDYNTILYGHNMRNGTMFAGLHDFEDPEFVQQNRQIIIYLPDRRLTYQIIAVSIVDDSHLLYKYNNFNAEGQEAFWQELQDTDEAGEYFDTSYQKTRDEHLITLSTCIGSRPNNRLIVVGALVDETELATSVGSLP